MFLYRTAFPFLTSRQNASRETLHPAQGKLGKFPEGTIAEVWGATTLMEGAYGVLNNNSNVKAILGGPCAWQPSDRLPCHLRPFHQSNRLRRNAAARRLP